MVIVMGGNVLWLDNMFHGSYRGKWDGSDCFENKGMSSMSMVWCPVEIDKRKAAVMRHMQEVG